MWWCYYSKLLTWLWTLLLSVSLLYFVILLQQRGYFLDKKHPFPPKLNHRPVLVKLRAPPLPDPSDYIPTLPYLLVSLKTLENCHILRQVGGKGDVRERYIYSQSRLTQLLSNIELCWTSRLIECIVSHSNAQYDVIGRSDVSNRLGCKQLLLNNDNRGSCSRCSPINYSYTWTLHRYS